MSEYVLTPNLGLYKPAVDADEDHWGDHWNLNADTLDNVLATSGTGLFLPLVGGQMTGPIMLAPDAPIFDNEAAPKSYVDTLIDDLGDTAADTFLKLTGGSMTGPLHLKPGTPPAADEAMPKSYVDAQVAAGPFVKLAGDTMTGDLNIVASYASVILKKSAAGAGYANQLVGYTGGNARWNLQVGDSTAESGSDLGSDFAIHRYNDAGAYIDTPFTIARATGRVNITRDGLTVFGHDRMTLDAGTGHAIIRYNNNYHQWWAGNDPGDSGNWNVYDQNANRTVLKCQTDGGVYVPLNFYSGYIESYGYTVSRNNVIVRNGGAPTLAMHNTNGYAAGIMCESNGRMTLGWTGGSGESLDWQMFFDRGGYAQFRYRVNFPNIYVDDRVNCSQSMNRSGIFRVADNDAYYMERSGGDGHWRWVDNWNVLFTVYNTGEARSQSTFYSSANVFAGNNVYAGNSWSQWFGFGGSGRILQFSGSWFLDWNWNDGTLAWQTPSGWAMIWYGDRSVNVANRLFVQGENIYCQNGCYGVRYQAGSYNSGHAFLFGWSNYVGGCPTCSVDNGGAVIPLANALSDERIKVDIQPSKIDALDVANRIGLVEYDLLDINDPWALKQARRKNRKSKLTERRRIGMVAQELRKVFPEAVIVGDTSETMLGRIWSIDTNTMLALLVKSVQQLTDRIEELEAT